MPDLIRASFALGAGLLLAAAEAPLRDLVREAPGTHSGATMAEPMPNDPSHAASSAGITAGLVRIEGPATPIPPPPAPVITGNAGADDATLPAPPGPQPGGATPAGAAPPPARSLAEAVDRYRGRPEAALDRQGRCLAKAVYWEAKGEPLSGQLAVAQVILNRVESGRFGRDICSVVTARGQFSFVRGGQIPEAPHRAQWATARAVAQLALDGGWTEVVGDATHFHATRVNPGWRMTRVAAIGNHIFYR